LDENFPKAAVTFLQRGGHEVFDFQGSLNEGMEYLEVFAMAQQLGAILLTTDRDFFHTIPHLFDTHHGVIVIALRRPNRAAILSKLVWVLSRVAPENFPGRAFQLRDHTWTAVPSMELEA
jgi:predicted nuclease of predicted toxin-antitoxin system